MMAAKRSKAFNSDFSFDPNDTEPVVKKVKKAKKSKSSIESTESNETAVPESGKSLSTIDSLIENCKKEKSSFYSQLTQHTAEQSLVLPFLFTQN